MSKIHQDTITKLQTMLFEGYPETEVRKWLRTELHLSKSQGNAKYNEIVSGLKKVKKTEPVDNVGLEFVSEKYTYNEVTDVYIVNLKCQSKPLVISGAKHRAICRSYSEWGEGLTADEICKKYALTPTIFDEYRRVFNLTKQKEPLSIEEVMANSVEDNVAKILEEKRYKIYQQFEKESWKRIQGAALKWEKFQSKQFDPFVNFLESWQPPIYNKVKLETSNKKNDKYLVATLSDIHVGLISHDRYNYLKGKWNHEELEKSVKSYVAQMRDEVADRKTGFKSAYLLLMGDICHTLSGFTDKGTKLETEFLAENQFDLAFNITVYFINELLTFLPEVNIKSVAGNHSSFGDYVVAFALEKYFRNEPRVTFENTTKRFLTFRIEDTLFLIEHGYSAHYHARLPEAGAKRETYITNLFLTKPDLLKDLKQKVFISADQHHMEAREYHSFEHYMLGTIVSADRHSDNCGYNNRPRQSCLVVDKDGVKGLLHFFFD